MADSTADAGFDPCSTATSARNVVCSVINARNPLSRSMLPLYPEGPHLPVPTVPTEAQTLLDSYLTEHQHQVRVVQWCLFEASPAIRLRSAQIYAIPSGGHRNPAVAAQLKAEGVVRGIPDLHLPVAAGGHHGLYIEMKKFGGRPSPEQLIRIGQLRKNGYRAVIAVGWREAVAIITDYLGQP